MEINTRDNDNNHSVFKEKMQRCQDYMQGLEQERCKVLVFQRELPLCLELVTQAIESCKQQLSENRQLSECSEQTSSDAPGFEEFIPIIKRASSNSVPEEEQESKKQRIDETIDEEGQNGNNDDTNVKKSDWLRSVQLWNQSPDPPSKEDDSPNKVKKSGSGGAFHPFKKDENVARPVENLLPPVSTSSTDATGGGGYQKDEKDGQSRKTRRCWSPELHKRFLQALQQLGGSHLATPKQIRELMKVEGLTNDEVKSHLQKYRLHTRRPSPSNQNTTGTQAPQFVVVAGGLWMPTGNIPAQRPVMPPRTESTPRLLLCHHPFEKHRPPLQKDNIRHRISTTEIVIVNVASGRVHLPPHHPRIQRPFSEK